MRSQDGQKVDGDINNVFKGGDPLILGTNMFLSTCRATQLFLDQCPGNHICCLEPILKKANEIERSCAKDSY